MSTLLRNIRVRQQANPGLEVLWGPDGDTELLDGTIFVSVTKPFEQADGGPSHGVLYRIRAVEALTGLDVDLQHMRFSGFGPLKGNARFADQ